MSSYSEDEYSPEWGTLESRASGDCATVEAGDVEGCLEKLSQHGTVRVNIFDEVAAREWLKRIQAHSKVTWRVLMTVPGGLRNVFKAQYRCQHKARYKKAQSGKYTGCPARLQVTLKRTQLARGKSRSKDALISSHPLIATLHGGHNHAIESAAALKYRDVSEEVQQHLKDLFADGHTPSSAYDLLHSHLMASDPEKYLFSAADRHFLPDLKYCYNLYYKDRKLNREAAGTAAEVPSCSQADDASRQSELSQTQHAPDEELQASETALPAVCSDLEQRSEDEAALENTDEWLQTVATMRAFLDAETAAATAEPERRKYLTAMAKTVRRLGRGRALDCAMLTFGQRTMPSLRAINSCTTIGVQPTAIARRKMPLGGRKRIHAGRLASAAQSVNGLLQVATRRKVAAPHSLSQCIANNTTLGKSHQLHDVDTAIWQLDEGHGKEQLQISTGASTLGHGRRKQGPMGSRATS